MNSKILIAASIVGITMSVWFLQQSSELGQEASGSAQAVVQEVEGDVRVRRAQSFHWNTMNDEIDAYSGDSVFSGKESKAQLNFADGSSATLLPNSLVVIYDDILSIDQGEIILNIQLGKGKVKRIKVGDQVVTLKRSGIVRASSDGEQVKVQFKEREEEEFTTLYEEAPKAKAVPAPPVQEAPAQTKAPQPRPAPRRLAPKKTRPTPRKTVQKPEPKEPVKTVEKNPVEPKTEPKESAFHDVFFFVDSSSIAHSVNVEPESGSATDASDTSSGFGFAARWESDIIEQIPYPVAVHISRTAGETSSGDFDYTDLEAGAEAIYQNAWLKAYNLELLGGLAYRSYTQSFPLTVSGSEKDADASSQYGMATFMPRWSINFYRKWSAQVWPQLRVPLISGYFALDYKLLGMVGRDTKWGHLALFIESSKNTEVLDYENGSVTGEADMKAAKTGFGALYKTEF